MNKVAILNNLKSILKYSFTFLFIIVLSTIAPEGASAKTITSTTAVDETIINYFDNILERKHYRSYLLASEYEGSNYNYTTYYYVCFTNEEVDLSNTTQVSANCEEMYRYYRANNVTNIEKIEDDYYVRIEHDMTKQHYISFIAALSSDKIQMIKLYPEGNAEARFPIRGVKKILFYCNKDGLFFINTIKGIDDKECSYDDTEERRELEQAAKMLFG